MVFAFYYEHIYHGANRWVPVGFLESEGEIANGADGLYAIYGCTQVQAGANKMPEETLPKTLTFKRLRVSKTPQVKSIVEAP